MARPVNIIGYLSRSPYCGTNQSFITWLYTFAISSQEKGPMWGLLFFHNKGGQEDVSVLIDH